MGLDVRISVKSTRTKYSTVVAALTVLPILSGCANGDSVVEGAGAESREQIVVAADASVESSVLAEVYSTVLSSSGLSARVESVGGGRNQSLEALDAARVTLVPEFTGALLDHYDPSSPAREADDVFEALSRSLPEGLSVSDYAMAEDRAVVALDTAYAQSLGAKTIEAFASSCAAATPLVSARFVEDGAVEQLAEGAECVFAGVDQSTPADVPGAQVFGTTTLSALAQSDAVTVLADSNHVLAAQNVVPLFRTGALGDSAVKALSVVAGELSTTDLATMIEQVRAGNASASEVARTWWDTRQ